MKFCALCRERGLPVEEGVFRATMQVRIVNEGPVTMILDSRLASRAAQPDGAT